MGVVMGRWVRVCVSLSFVVLAASCASCPNLEAGIYTIAFAEVAGDCGAQDSTTVTLSAGALPVIGDGSGCTGLLDIAEDGCSANFDRTCPGPSGSTLRVEGYSESVTTTQAHMEFTLTLTGSITCRSSYRADAFR